MKLTTVKLMQLSGVLMVLMLQLEEVTEKSNYGIFQRLLPIYVEYLVEAIARLCPLITIQVAVCYWQHPTMILHAAYGK